MSIRNVSDARIRTMLKDLGRARRDHAQRIQRKRTRRAQMREWRGRTLYTAGYLFPIVALVAWMLSW